MANITFPVEPLLHAARRKGYETNQDIADALGICRQSVSEWGESFTIRGGDSLQRLDRYACAFGMHPSWIWPQWFDVSIAVPLTGGCEANPDLAALPERVEDAVFDEFEVA